MFGAFAKGSRTPTRKGRAPVAAMTPPRSPPPSHRSTPGRGAAATASTGAAAAGSSSGAAAYDANSTILLEGYLMKLKQTSHWVQHYKWNKRWFQIRDGFLLYFKRRGQRQPAGWLRVGQIKQIKAMDAKAVLPGTNRSGDNCFQVSLSSRSLLLRARSTEEAHMWMKTLTDAIRDAESGGDPSAKGGNPASTPVASSAAAAGPTASPKRRFAPHVAADTAPPRSPTPFWDGKADFEWVEYWDDESYRPYYVNTRTQESVWEIPSAARSIPAAAAAARDAAAAAAEAVAVAERTAATAEAVRYEAAARSPEAKADDGGYGAPATAEEPAAAEPVATEAPPAHGWIKCFDYDFGSEYFYNTHTGESTYEVPAALAESEAAAAADAAAASEGKDGSADGKAADGTGAAAPAAAAEYADVNDPSQWKEYWTARDYEEAPGGSGETKADAKDDEAVRDAYAAAAAAEGDADEEAEYWTECWDATYQLPYYVSSKTLEPVWDRPADDNLIVQYNEEAVAQWPEEGAAAKTVAASDAAYYGESGGYADGTSAGYDATGQGWFYTQ